MRLIGVALSAMMLPGIAIASEAGDRLAEVLYAGEAAGQRPYFEEQCAVPHTDACFGLGLIHLIGAVEGLSQGFYRHGAVTPRLPAAAMMLGLDADLSSGPPNASPEALDYAGLRQILSDFVTGLDRAQASFEKAGAEGDYVITLDPLRVRLDINGDGDVGERETLAMLFGEQLALPQGRSKGDKMVAPDLSIGFDRADAIWLAGYSQISAIPFDMLLAHDFSRLFEAVGHRLFPEAGLPMQDYSRGGTLMMDPETDTFLADLIAGLHTSNFPIVDKDRFAGVQARMQAVTALSRQNWAAILQETDDNRELVPSPRQTSLVPGQPVTEEIVEAWMATLDRLDEILAGELLLPHWRFRRGFDLNAYFATATETDIVMLLAGQGALPFLKEGPIADAESFAEGNRVFGENWPNFAIWFN
ncbi:hypothetical protein GGR20_001241 [Devosia subaequoris]|uniref:Uncharacterized protein n=1 Tax=Devosia subaequoris TaxID=395930 RepID=A0A7W6IL71_9HYPH|nr:hypothetical protein [Devosia subaequoris]MBB4051605.1 hypothetical protein [Devosia subaequoris]MCP1209195.1 hypothetical protein [Devosia subaequoris]